jgi:hypothetical protein
MSTAYQLWDRHNLELVLFARALVGFVLVLAAVPKLTAPQKFARVVAQYRLLPNKFSSVVGRILPASELFAGVAVLLGCFSPWPSFLATLLFALFVVAISVNLLRGRRYIQCGCFGIDKAGHLRWYSVLRSAILAGISYLTAGAPTSLACLRLPGCGPNPIMILSVSDTLLVISSSLGILSILSLFGIAKRLVTLLPDREMRFSVAGIGNRISGELSTSARQSKEEAI